VSGFAGLIYESIWSHYLKLFLGHAAYAQTLVLAIFMGGMALGSWICSRFSGRWPNLLRGYALAEAAVGLAALAFHAVYVWFLDVSYESILPVLGSAAAISAWKWIASGLLILPQSILLGMTFPLMTAGVIRRFPANTGATIALLYFTNSLGAAVGVLVSGFVLIAAVGLPGTLAVAGCLNLILALVVWRLSPPRPRVGASESAPAAAAATPSTFRMLLAVALATGAASFIYEIAWIRMLSLVLGSSTHSFELMLSAFISGIALGGLWIRRRIDRLGSPVAFLAGIQVAMGLLALATLPLYANSFEVMRWLMANLPKTELGYLGFNLASHGIALVVMLPATFCAGTTLPLITVALLRDGNGERSIGAVYAWNTVGAIAGVFAAVHFGMPILGLKGLLAAGAVIDIAVGSALAARTWGPPRAAAIAGASGAILLGAVLLVPLEAHEMASGVFRPGSMIDTSKEEVVFHRDGKTATVSVTGNLERWLSIRTNGKPDATVSLAAGPDETIDEHTMIFAGLIPLALHPSARTAANIGMGSGLTTHTLLSSAQLERVDTIEIEPAMVEGARLFRRRVWKVYDDPRSRIHFDDAKAFFSTRNARYDIIISEPSNPWVSGVAALFSREFYHRVKTHLDDGGLFIQWFQYYEMDESLVVAVLKALVEEFADFHIYAANRGDLIIVAAEHPIDLDISGSLFAEPGLAPALKRISIATAADVELRWLGNRTAFEPFVRNYPVPINSDFHPILDLYAVRSRFLGESAAALFSPELERLPVLEMLGRRRAWDRDTGALTYTPRYERSQTAHLAAAILRYLLGGDWSWSHPDLPIPPNVLRYATQGRRATDGCESPMDPSRWIDSLYNSLVRRVLPFVSSGELEGVWKKLQTDACWANLDAVQREFVLMWQAVGRRDAAGMSRHANAILDSPVQLPPVLLHHVVSVAVLGLASEGEAETARALWNRRAAAMRAEDRDSLRTRILLSHVRAPAQLP
jgi:predicted membrane-bound spermidine synthase